MMHRVLAIFLAFAIVVLPVQAQGRCACVDAPAESSDTSVQGASGDTCCGSDRPADRLPADGTPRDGTPCDDAPGGCECPMPCCVAGKTLITVPVPLTHAAHPFASPAALLAGEGTTHAAHTLGLKRPPRRAIPA